MRWSLKVRWLTLCHLFVGRSHLCCRRIFSFINGFIVVLIACIPQGLPMTVVSCLTITSRRLSEKKVFVKQLQSVETLGSVTVIATVRHMASSSQLRAEQ